jgi:SAM-dependent methyltransferase
VPLTVDHWTQFYRGLDAGQKALLSRPSAFARWFARLFGDVALRTLVDVGCGTGRDAVFWATCGWKATAVDACPEAVACSARLAEADGASCAFMCGDCATAPCLYGEASVVYARWFLHAVDQAVQDQWLASLTAMRPGALLAIEARATGPVLGSGRHVETRHGHYRRLLYPPLLVEEIRAAGFAVLRLTAGRGLAVLGHGDPLVVWVIAKRGSSRETSRMSG